MEFPPGFYNILRLLTCCTTYRQNFLKKLLNEKNNSIRLFAKFEGDPPSQMKNNKYQS